MNLEGRAFLRFQLFSPHGSLLSFNLLAPSQFILFYRFSHSVVTSIKQSIEDYITALNQDITLIQATLQSKSAFVAAINAKSSMKNVHLESNWFGLGAVRITPSYLKEDVPSGDSEHDINEFNAMVAEKLAEQDQNLFRTGLSPGTTRVCIFIGVVRTFILLLAATTGIDFLFLSFLGFIANDG